MTSFSEMICEIFQEIAKFPQLDKMIFGSPKIYGVLHF